MFREAKIGKKFFKILAAVASKSHHLTTTTDYYIHQSQTQPISLLEETKKKTLAQIITQEWIFLLPDLSVSIAYCALCAVVDT